MPTTGDAMFEAKEARNLATPALTIFISMRIVKMKGVGHLSVKIKVMGLPSPQVADGMGIEYLDNLGNIWAREHLAWAFATSVAQFFEEASLVN